MTQEQNQIIDIIPSSKNLTKTSQKENLKELTPYWDKEYINECINKITNTQDRVFITTLWLSGIRISECVSLTKKNISFKDYMIKVKWLKSRKYKERILPIHPRLKDILQIYTAGMNEEDRIFPFTRQRGYQITTKWLKGNPHKIRHSFAVNWLRSNADIIILHRILGHSKVQTTMEYLKIVPLDQGRELLKVNFD
jgi:integrase/recombinase XerD